MNNKKFISSTKEQITPAALNECRCKLVEQGTILFSFKLSIGKVCITDTPIYTNEAIAALPIKDKKRIDKWYLYHTLKSLKINHLGERAVKGIILNKEKLKKLEIPTPPRAATHRGPPRQG